MSKARALYDFKGEENSAELSITAGEILTITRKDVGEGWWEGTSSQGKAGLFPAAYVEEISSGPPSMPPPLLPDKIKDDWDDQNNHRYNVPCDQEEAWDDDWDDDDTYSTIAGNQDQPQTYGGQQEQIYANTPEYPVPMPSLPKLDDAETSSVIGDSKGTVSKKSMNRFGTFSKSGGDSYLLGTLKVNVSEADKVYIRQTEDGYQWDPIKRSYTVSVASPKKESKLKGLKSFIAYQLTPSFNNLQVSRRYKHFDWLHERLSEKFCLIAIPPLPDKQISNRYDDTFIEHRRIQLQEFVDWVCRHPVLSYSQVWQHFLTCTDEKRWKTGKRQAEKDPLVGANFCSTIIAPEKNLQMSFIEAQMETTTSFIHGFETANKNLFNTAVDQCKKHQVQYKREFVKIGETFAEFGGALELDDAKNPTKLTHAIKRTGLSYLNIAKIFEHQPKHDWEPLSNKLHLYRGLTGSFLDVINQNRGAIQKRKECEKLTGERKMDNAQLLEVQKRVEVVNYSVLAETNLFRTERTLDLRNTMKSFLEAQVTFYQKIVNELQNALKEYDE